MSVGVYKFLTRGCRSVSENMNDPMTSLLSMSPFRHAANKNRPNKLYITRIRRAQASATWAHAAISCCEHTRRCQVPTTATEITNLRCQKAVSQPGGRRDAEPTLAPRTETITLETRRDATRRVVCGDDLCFSLSTQYISATGRPASDAIVGTATVIALRSRTHRADWCWLQQLQQ